MRIQGLMYTDCINLLGSKKSKRLSKNTIIEINDNNYNTVYVILHHSTMYVQENILNQLIQNADELPKQRRVRGNEP